MKIASRLSTLAETSNRLPAENTRTPVPRDVLRAVVNALRSGETHYTDRPGVPLLRRTLAAWLDGAGIVGLSRDDLVVTAGVEEAAFIALMALDVRGATVLVDAPAPSAHAERATLLGARVVREIEAESAGARNVSVRIVSVTTALGRTEAFPAVSAGTTLIVDLGAPDWPRGTARLETVPNGSVVWIGSLDGIEGLAPFRVGFLASADTELVVKSRTWKQAFSICTAAPSQAAAVAALHRVMGGS